MWSRASTTSRTRGPRFLRSVIFEDACRWSRVPALGYIARLCRGAWRRGTRHRPASSERHRSGSVGSDDATRTSSVLVTFPLSRGGVLECWRGRQRRGRGRAGRQHQRLLHRHLGGGAGRRSLTGPSSRTPANDPPTCALTASFLRHGRRPEATIGDPDLCRAPPTNSGARLSAQPARIAGSPCSCAIGDWGSADLVIDGECHVLPAGRPVGHRVRRQSSARSPIPASRRSFGAKRGTASPFQNFPYDRPRTGVRDPSRHRDSSDTHTSSPISNNDGNARRGVPDPGWSRWMASSSPA